MVTHHTSLTPYMPYIPYMHTLAINVYVMQLSRRPTQHNGARPQLCILPTTHKQRTAGNSALL